MSQYNIYKWYLIKNIHFDSLKLLQYILWGFYRWPRKNANKKYIIHKLQSLALDGYTCGNIWCHCFFFQVIIHRLFCFSVIDHMSNMIMKHPSQSRNFYFCYVAHLIFLFPFIIRIHLLFYSTIFFIPIHNWRKINSITNQYNRWHVWAIINC